MSEQEKKQERESTAWRVYLAALESLNDTDCDNDDYKAGLEDLRENYLQAVA